MSATTHEKRPHDMMRAGRPVPTYDLTTIRGVGRCKCTRGVQGHWFEWNRRYAPVLLQDEDAALVDHSIGVYVLCPDCGARVVLTAVKGRYRPEITCGAKCRNAVGPSCDCSCGGANHGCNH